MVGHREVDFKFAHRLVLKLQVQSFSLRGASLYKGQRTEMSPSSRRDFLKNVGVGVPTLKALLAQGAVPAAATSVEAICIRMIDLPLNRFSSGQQ
jgi:hypothetical protein